MALSLFALTLDFGKMFPKTNVVGALCSKAGANWPRAPAAGTTVGLLSF